MSKHYNFSDCVSYAHAHNIAFNFYYLSCEHLHYVYADISDGALCLNNEHRCAASTIHGSGVWSH